MEPDAVKVYMVFDPDVVMLGLPVVEDAA